VELKHESLAVIPLGGQSEIGQVLWALICGGEILLLDAGAAYPSEELPGVDLLLPNTNFLEANHDKIVGLLLTNANEEHCGAVSYLLHHLKIPKILGPRFVSAFLAQCAIDRNETGFECPAVDVIELRRPYKIGLFEVEWMQVNDAVADACALKIKTPQGVVVYTSSFKLDQTPVDHKSMDVGALAQLGDEGALLLISDSAGVEFPGYTPSEIAVKPRLSEIIADATGRVIVVLPGANTHRLQILFDIASGLNRKVALLGETLIRTAVSAAITGNLVYDRKIESSVADIEKIQDNRVLIIASGLEGDPMQILNELALERHPEFTVKTGDTVVYSAEVYPGRSRQMAFILDQFLSIGVKTIFGSRQKVHVSKHASQEELKLMLSLVMPRYFIPALGEGRHIMHHAQLAEEWGMPDDAIFPLKNGDILELNNGAAAKVGSIEAQAIYFNREQGERVTTYSVNERRNLSLDGIVTIGLVVTKAGELISGPTIEVNASGFLRSPEWEVAKIELINNILEAIQRFAPGSNAPKQQRASYELPALRAAVRDVAAKTLRSKLQSKPNVQVIIHELLPAL
jgi:ribonuclease J